MKKYSLTNFGSCVGTSGLIMYVMCNISAKIKTKQIGKEHWKRSFQTLRNAIQCLIEVNFELYRSRANVGILEHRIYYTKIFFYSEHPSITNNR